MADELGRIGVIVAARTGSSRLPGKVLRQLGGRPMILFLLDRLRASRLAETPILATTTLPGDDELATIVGEAGNPVFRGDQNDVVRRYVDAASMHGFDYVVRVTGDCPFVDAETLDYCIDHARQQAPFDLATTKGRFPVGIDYEIYNAQAMRAIHANEDLDTSDREHLTLYMYKNRARYRIIELEPRPEWKSDQHYTVDTQDDYARADAIVTTLGDSHFSIRKLVELTR
jgi:spore coat polysaccharide biosynthesis protein SpsF